MANNNYLIGFGERLARPISLKQGGGAKNYPYTFEGAKARLGSKLERAVSNIRALPDLACPADETVIALTLHPTFLARSYYPTNLMHDLNLRPVGSHARAIIPGDIPPVRGFFENDSQREPAAEIFVAGQRSDLRSFTTGLPRWLPRSATADDFRKIEDIRSLDVSRVRPIEGDGILPLEVVLHADGTEASDYILSGFKKFIEELGLEVDLEERLHAGVADDRQGVGRRHVPAWRKIWRRPVGRDREDKLDLADIGRQAGAATHGMILAVPPCGPKGISRVRLTGMLQFGWKGDRRIDSENMVTSPTVREAVAALKPKTIDPFSSWVIDGAERALADEANPLRLNFFSTAMRILFEHMMDTLAPRDQVIQCQWFKRKEGESSKPKRSERILFAIQGGLSEEFVQQDLQIDTLPLRSRLLSAIDELSKHIHGRANTIVRDLSAQDTIAKATVTAMGAFLDAVHECRAAVLEPIAEALDNAAVDALITDTIDAIDELASHHSVEDVDIDEVIVQSISAETITYRAKGAVSVVLQWGSNSDVRRGDGIELGQSFSFYCDIEVPLSDPWELSGAETSYGVDTGDWRERTEPDDWDR